MTTTLFSGGPIHTLGNTAADWVLIEDDRIAALGTGEAPGADRVVDLTGATLVPAFCDGHAHLPATGLYAGGLDFRGERSADAILAAFESAASRGGVLFGGNFEDPLDRPLEASDLDRVVGDRPALLARADMHSCVVSSALLERFDLAGRPGVDRDADGNPTGYLREQAAAAAWTWFDANLPRHEQIGAIKAAVKLAYSKGVAAVHEMYVVDWRGWASLDVMAEALEGVALSVIPYVATDDVERVKARGLPRVGGDYFLDGSFGSHTAWLSSPYASPPPFGSPSEGIAYHSDDDVCAFFLEAQTMDLQAGVHAIGDAAISQAIEAWRRVAEKVGVERVRAKGHRIEHFECASDRHIDAARDLGLRVSVQPAFDHYWGGEDGLYATRIGPERALEMNRFRSMLDAGLTVGAGSDSTVTPLDPFLQMHALRNHHRADQRIDARSALRMHTIGSHSLSGHDQVTGSIELGKRADLATLDRDPLEVEGEELLKTEVLGTWIGGRRVHPAAQAEAA